MYQSLHKISFICSLLTLICSFSCFAQTNWDQALDKYESICNSCIELRAKVSAGESVSNSAVTSLLQELVTLRTTLQQAEGSMTKAQRQRFSRIRDNYTGASSSKKTVTQSTTIAGASTPKPTQTTSKKETAVISDSTTENADSEKTLERAILELEKVEDLIAGPVLTTEESSLLHDDRLSESSHHDPRYDQVDSGFSRETVFHLGALLNVGCSRLIPIGGTMFVTYKKIGGYISYNSTLKNTAVSYRCDSSGMIENGGGFWGNGETRNNFKAVSIGPVYNLPKDFSVFAGAGYGSSATYWQDIDSNWAEVQDISHSGLIIQAGVMKRIRIVGIAASVQYLPSGGDIMPYVSVGISF